MVLAASASQSIAPDARLGIDAIAAPAPPTNLD